MTIPPQTISAPKPADIPVQSRARSLERLSPLVGTWDTEASFRPGQLGAGTPATVTVGQTVFEWMDGGAFLIQRFSSQRFSSQHSASGDPAVPSGMAVIGPVTETESVFIQHYYDSRGVARAYRMLMTGETLMLSRESPGFCQRYRATFSADGTVLTGAWEYSADGEEWEYDFGLTYRKAG